MGREAHLLVRVSEILVSCRQSLRRLSARLSTRASARATTGFTITNTEVPHDTPKPKEDTPKKSNRKPAKKSGGVVPYTGDSNATGIAIALASAAVVLIGGGVYLRRRGQHK